jgi:hypothetical protein
MSIYCHWLERVYAFILPYYRVQLCYQSLEMWLHKKFSRVQSHSVNALQCVRYFPRS